MVWQFLRKKKNLGDSLVRVHGALGTAQAITLVLVVIVCVMSVKYLVKTILKDVHCILFLLPGKQWKRVRLRRTLTAESFLPGLSTKHSFVKSVFFFRHKEKKLAGFLIACLETAAMCNGPLLRLPLPDTLQASHKLELLKLG